MLASCPPGLTGDRCSSSF